MVTKAADDAGGRIRRLARRRPKAEDGRREYPQAAGPAAGISKAYIGLGSNLGDRTKALQSALNKLDALPRTRVIRFSKFHETDPVGGPPQRKFLNAAAELETELEPLDLLRQIQKIEREMGRPAAHERWGPRTIDLDLLAYDNLVLQTPELTLPHPRMQGRPFVLVPLAEITPEFDENHPKRG